MCQQRFFIFWALHTVSGHARLARDTSRDENNLSTLKALAETRRSGVVALDGRLGVDVADIGGDT